MSPRRVLSYSDTVEVRRPRAVRSGGGIPGATDTVLAHVDVSDAERRAAGLFVASCAVTQGWESDGGLPLAAVLDQLGLTT